MSICGSTMPNSSAIHPGYLLTTMQEQGNSLFKAGEFMKAGWRSLLSWEAGLRWIISCHIIMCHIIMFTYVYHVSNMWICLNCSSTAHWTVDLQPGGFCLQRCAAWRWCASCRCGGGAQQCCTGPSFSQHGVGVHNTFFLRMWNIVE